MDSSYNSESLQTAVEEAEAHFLLGNFQKSLLVCNQILSNATTASTAKTATTDGSSSSSGKKEEEKEDGSSTIFLLLETPIQLSIDPTNKLRRVQISIRVVVPTVQRNNNDDDDDDDVSSRPPPKSSKGSADDEDDDNSKEEEQSSNNSSSSSSSINSRIIIDWIDRAAAVALQCWYEIARQIMDQKQQPRKNKSATTSTSTPSSASTSTTAQGYVHLLPFLNLYTTTTTTATACNASAGAAESKVQDHNNNNNKNKEIINNKQKSNKFSCRPMPLELAVVFVQFLQTGTFCGQDREVAVELISEILFRLAVGIFGPGLGGAGAIGDSSQQQQQKRTEPVVMETAGSASTTTTTTTTHHEENISCLEELFFLLMVDILPFCTSQSLVVKILKRFLQPVWRGRMSTTTTSNNRSSSSITTSTTCGRRRRKEEEFITRDYPNSDSIYTILSFLNSVPPSWSRHQQQRRRQSFGIFPSKQFIGECRASLQNLLKSIEEQQHGQQEGMLPYYYSKNQQQSVQVEDDNQHHNINHRSIARRRLPFLEEEGTSSSALVGELDDDLVLAPSTTTRDDNRKGAYDYFYHLLFSSLSNMSNEMGSIIQKCKNNKGSLAFILLLTILAWKKRKRVLSLSSSAIRLFLAPLREVVDALMISPPPP